MITGNMAGKTAYQRVQELRKRHARLGLIRVELYAHPEDQASIKRYAQQLRAKREKQKA